MYFISHNKLKWLQFVRYNTKINVDWLKSGDSQLTDTAPESESRIIKKRERAHSLFSFSETMSVVDKYATETFNEKVRTLFENGQ